MFTFETLALLAAIIAVACLVWSRVTMTASLSTVLSSGTDGQGITTTDSFAVTDSGSILSDPTIPANTNNVEVGIAFTIAALKSIRIDTDVTVTLETNDGTTPDDTFTITAGTPFFWMTGTGIANPFDTNVTKFFFSNATNTNASVRIRGVRDDLP